MGAYEAGCFIQLFTTWDSGGHQALLLANGSFSLSVLHRCCPSKKPPPKLKESLGYYVHIYIPLPHRCGCLHRCKWEGYSPTSQTALQVPLRILFGVTILEIVRTQSARFLPSCFGIGGGGIPTSRQHYISSLKWCSALLVRVKGYDPSIPYGQWFLRPFCIPIPTHSHLKCISLFPGHQRQWVRHNHEFQKLIRFTQSY